jgi:hypothetical protein
VNENTVLKTENTSLRHALSQFEGVVPKVELSSDLAYRKTESSLAKHATKMAGLISSATTIGGNRPTTTAKAGVCLLLSNLFIIYL